MTSLRHNISTGHDAHLLPLSSPNLRKLGGAKLSDKDRFLRSYIRSQEAHLSSYALEGKSVAASWNVEETNDPPKTISRLVELESGFGTPMLKPRTSITKIAGVQAQDVKQDRGSARQKDGKENTYRGSSASGDVAEENVASRGERDDDRRVRDSRGAKRARRKEEKSTPLKAQVPAGSKPKHKVSRKPPVEDHRRDPDSEEERRNRLAERRERRRAKKAIVDPKPDPPASNASDSESDNGRKRKNPKGKKAKGLNIPAGLALMHGFSATNIGKNRLTVEPAVGVFNKGKASARTKVKKAKEKDPPSKAKMFSENWFLGKTKADSWKAASTSSQSSVSNHRRKAQSEDVSSEPERPQGKTKPSKGKAEKHKRPRSPSTVDASSNECEEPASHSGGRLVKKRKTKRAESPVWDIELEDGQLPSDSHSDGHVVSEGGTKVAGTLLLDTRAFSSRWAIPKDKHDSPTTGPTIEKAERTAEIQDDHRSDGASTIDPSHSASQVAYRGTTFSRFFPRPGGIQGESVAREEPICHRDAATPVVQPTSRQGNPSDDPDDPDDTVQSRMVQPAWDMPIDSLGSLHQDGAEPLLSPQRAPAGFPPVHDKSPLPAIARPPSSASSSKFRQDGVPGVDDCGIHPEYVSSISLDAPLSPLLPSISMGGIEATGLGDQDATSVRDWTNEFLGLLGDDAPTDLFLSNVTGNAGSLEQPTGDDVYLGLYPELAVEELPASPGFDTWELECEDTRRAVCDPYLIEGSEEPYDTGCHHDLEYPLEHLGSAPTSYDNTRQELYNIPYPRKRVKFSDDVLCYEDDRDICMDNAEAGGVWEWQTEPGINNAECDMLGEVGLSECGDPDDRSAGTAEPDPALLGATSPEDFDVAVEDESSQPEEDMGGVGSSECEMEEERSVLGSLQRFSQGRALLMGVASEIGVDGVGTRLGVSAVEEDVVKNLRGHWRPHRF